ncbi:hypothetical protein GCM10007874_31590 [Labrys miyagiensis]|uniref:Uncharacterized protein n=2 Tax=Labrys miyagiensis TaxID=346912 RepID=A0ABQ6CPK3_9HYPH|nr:hypothetical protein GCM10007874_31590 [Labrys miyagiensis]
MPYVQRNSAGAITGVYANLQVGYAKEWLAPDDPAVITFLTPGPPEILTRWQFFAVAALNGIITQQEAQAALTGTMPAKFTAFIASMPADQQFPATMLLTGTQEFHRHHPFVEAFLHANSMTSAQADAIWTQGAALTLS